MWDAAARPRAAVLEVEGSARFLAFSVDGRVSMGEMGSATLAFRRSCCPRRTSNWRSPEEIARREVEAS